MQSRRFMALLAARPGSVLALLLLQSGACGGEVPPPPARSAASAAPRGERTATGGSRTSLGDSALEPAAVEASKAEEWERAESLYRELVRRQPRSARARRGLGVALMHREKPDQAVEALEESVRLSDDAHARLDLAAAFSAMGRHPSALPHLRKAVQLSPRDPAPWSALVETLVKVEKPEAAGESLQESTKACPPCAADPGWNRAADEAARAIVTKADKQLAGGNRAGARKSTDLALALRPNLPEGQFVRGKLARAEGDTKGATSAFRKVVEQTPDAAGEPGAGARLELATLLLSAGGEAEAVKLAEEVVAARGTDGAALDTLGRACDAARNKDCARKAYAKLVQLPAADGPSKGALDHARSRMKQLKGRGRR